MSSEYRVEEREMRDEHDVRYVRATKVPETQNPWQVAPPGVSSEPMSSHLIREAGALREPT